MTLPSHCELCALLRRRWFSCQTPRELAGLCGGGYLGGRDGSETLHATRPQLGVRAWGEAHRKIHETPFPTFIPVPGLLGAFAPTLLVHQEPFLC